MKPIIFLLGPSGIGKSYLSEMLSKTKFLYVHIDTDSQKRTFAANSFPSEWDDDFRKVNLAHFVGELRDRLDNEHAGAVVSFPIVYVFTPEKLVEAEQLGVTPVVLWGKQKDCIRAAEKRIEKKGLKFNLRRAMKERVRQPFKLTAVPNMTPSDCKHSKRMAFDTRNKSGLHKSWGVWVANKTNASDAFGAR